MIEVTRLDNTKLTINIDLVERVEECPETIITFINGNKIMVKESIKELEVKYLALKHKIYGIQE